MVWLTALLAVVAVAGIVLAVRLLRSNRRDVALRDLLDGADALEAQLHEYKKRMTDLKRLLAQLPSDMTATAMASIDPNAQVQSALKEILAHRLWIKQEGATATQEALDRACEAIRKSRTQLAEQLEQLDEVGSELELAGKGLRSAYVEAAQAAAPRKKDPPGRKSNGHANGSIH